MALTGVAFLLIFGAALVMALVNHPRYGLYAYLLAFYGFPPGRWWGAYLPDLRWSFIAALVTLVAVLKLPKNREAAPWTDSGAAKLLIAFTVWLWIQNIWALYPPVHLELCILYTKYLVLFYLMARILDSEKELFNFAFAHVVGCFYFGWLAFEKGGGGRMEGIGSPGLEDANILAAHMVTGLFIASVLLFRATGLARVALVLMIPFILNTVILTQSRSAFLAMMCGGAVLFWLKPQQYKKIFYTLSILAVILFLSLAHKFFWERIASIGASADEEERDNSAEARVVLIQAQFEMWKLAPLLGHGHRGTVVLSPAFLDEKYLSGEGERGRRSSHNTFMSILVEQGVPGVVILLMLIAWVVRSLRRLKGIELDEKYGPLSIYRAALGGSLASLMVSGLFVDLLKLETFIWYFILLSQVLVLAGLQDAGKRSKVRKNREYA